MIAGKEKLVAPFPYFGGKSKVASECWRRFGAVRNYVEPFFGSGAMLFGRPQPFVGPETVNDKDGMLANFWRALQADPEQVAFHADWPVNENDLHARHAWLVNQKESLQSRLEGNPDYFDVKVAGWWVWGASCWIGSDWCSGNGPWRACEGRLQNLPNGSGPGCQRKRPCLTSDGQGVHALCRRGKLADIFAALSMRLHHVRVLCGDWSRVCTDAVTAQRNGLTAAFLDPPYADTAKRRANLYSKDSLQVAHDVREWAIANGDNPLFRIALCGHEDEHQMPDSWSVFSWKAGGSFKNCKRERIWFSPHCLPADTVSSLFNDVKVETVP